MFDRMYLTAGRESLYGFFRQDVFRLTFEVRFVQISHAFANRDLDMSVHTLTGTNK